MYKAQHILSKELVAVKTILKEGNDDDMAMLEGSGILDDGVKEAIEKELTILKETVDIHGVIEFYEVIVLDSRGSKTRKKSIWYSSCFKERSCSP